MVGTYHIVSEIPEDTENPDFWTKDEDVLGSVVIENSTMRHRGFFEVIDYTNDHILLEELHTRETKRIGRDDHCVMLDRPSIGKEFTVYWVDEEREGEWTRVEQHFYHEAGAQRMAKEIDNKTRLVSQTYHHREDEFASWDIKIGNDGPSVIPKIGNDGQSVIPEDFEENDIIDQVFRDIQEDVPEGVRVGTIYTDYEVGVHDREKEHEIVWYEIDYPYRADIYRGPIDTIDREKYM